MLHIDYLLDISAIFIVLLEITYLLEQLLFLFYNILVVIIQSPLTQICVHCIILIVGDHHSLVQLNQIYNFFLYGTRQLSFILSMQTDRHWDLQTSAIKWSPWCSYGRVLMTSSHKTSWSPGALLLSVYPKGWKDSPCMHVALLQKLQ